MNNLLVFNCKSINFYVYFCHNISWVETLSNIYCLYICNKMWLGYGIEVGTWPHLFLLLLQINCNEKITFMVALVEFVPIYKNLLHTKSAYNGRHSTEMCGYEIHYVSFPPFSHKWVIYAQECHKYWLVKPY